MGASTDKESPEEALGRALVERDRCRPLHRPPLADWPTPDYNSEEDDIRVEVKRLTDEVYREEK